MTIQIKHLLPLFGLLSFATVAAEKNLLPTSHTVRDVEGWTVRVDDRLLEGETAALGERALKLLQARLVAIHAVVPAQALAKLRAVTIQLDLNHGDLRTMQYHPDAGWLREHGYSERLAKCVHIPNVVDFLSPSENLRMPWAVLHELAHAFHDQVLGFDEPRVKAAWKKFCESGKYKSVLTIFGKRHEHYGLTDQKEFFAEMTECYFGSNDFYPFVVGELKESEPEVFALLTDIWGALPGLTPTAQASSSPVKVFVLAGQSNMEGQGVVDLEGVDYNYGKGTLTELMRDPAKQPLFRHLKDQQGRWATREDVWVRYRLEDGRLLRGPLTIGYTAYGDAHHFGPELQFGHVLGDFVSNQVLLVKTAWGGKSLYRDFRPPSSGGQVGHYYKKMIEEIREALANLKTDFPNYDGGGCELAGFVWYQGWNDGCEPQTAIPQYETNLVNLIGDIRREFNAPRLPVVIGELTGPWVEAPGEWAALRKAQAAAAVRSEFKDNVLFVETHDFVRKPEDSPNPSHGHHEFGNAETYFFVGDALGKGMIKLLEASRIVKAEPADGPREAIQTKIAVPNVTSHSEGLHGYISFGHEKLPTDGGYNAGMGFYAAVWPLIDRPLADFQIGLPSSWIIPDNSDNKDIPLCPEGTLARQWKERGPTWSSVFQTIEGGLGYWAGNHFRYGPPKFSMNATPQRYDYEIGSPGWSFFYSNEALPDDRLGIAQLSNRLLIPPDGLTFEGNPNGEFLGYTWMALPFTEPTTSDPPTGEQSWTCFISAANFKGPIAYYIPETWSKIGKLFNQPALYGRGLDTRPGIMGGGAMEINTVPRFDSKDTQGITYTKLPKLQWPVDAEGRAYLVQDVTYYSKAALYDAFKAWRDGGPPCSGRFGQKGAFKPKLNTRTTHYDQSGKKIVGVERVFDTRVFEGNVWGLQWFTNDIAPRGLFPQYYKHVGEERVAVPAVQVPPETGLHAQQFKLAPPGKPYTSPNSGAWTRPGPVRGPFKARLADGSIVTYWWYRFVDQPSFQQYNWSEEKRTKLQAFVEKLHAAWPIDRDYMPPPTRGKLVSLDPALIVKPPPGLEVGYVPIVTRQEMPP